MPYEIARFTCSLKLLAGAVKPEELSRIPGGAPHVCEHTVCRSGKDTPPDQLVVKYVLCNRKRFALQLQALFIKRARHQCALLHEEQISRTVGDIGTRVEQKLALPGVQ